MHDKVSAPSFQEYIIQITQYYSEYKLFPWSPGFQGHLSAQNVPSSHVRERVLFNQKLKNN